MSSSMFARRAGLLASAVATGGILHSYCSFSAATCAPASTDSTAPDQQRPQHRANVLPPSTPSSNSRSSSSTIRVDTSTPGLVIIRYPKDCGSAEFLAEYNQLGDRVANLAPAEFSLVHDGRGSDLGTLTPSLVAPSLTMANSLKDRVGRSAKLVPPETSWWLRQIVRSGLYMSSPVEAELFTDRKKAVQWAQSVQFAGQAGQQRQAL